MKGKTRFRKIVSFLITVLLVAAMLPAAAFADVEEELIDLTEGYLDSYAVNLNEATPQFIGDILRINYSPYRVYSDVNCTQLVTDSDVARYINAITEIQVNGEVYTKIDSPITVRTDTSTKMTPKTWFVLETSKKSSGKYRLYTDLFINVPDCESTNYKTELDITIKATGYKDLVMIHKKLTPLTYCTIGTSLTSSYSSITVPDNTYRPTIDIASGHIPEDWVSYVDSGDEEADKEYLSTVTDIVAGGGPLNGESLAEYISIDAENRAITFDKTYFTVENSDKGIEESYLGRLCSYTFVIYDMQTDISRYNLV